MNLQVFDNVEFGQIRVLQKDGQLWFVGKDVAEALGYSETNAMTKRLDDEDFISDKLEGMNMRSTLISESGLYSAVLGSKKEEAKKFKRWVTSEVLPQIRKTGGYIPIDETDDEEALMAKALMVAQRTIEKKNELLKQTQKELENKNKFISQIAISENSLLVREVAKIASKKDIKIGERRLWEKLRAWGLIFKNTTEPKQKGIDQGLFEVVEGTRESSSGVFTYRTTRVTGKGQAYIIERLLKEGV